MKEMTSRQQAIKINRLVKENEELKKKLVFVSNQLEWSRKSSAEETELKNSCFFFLISKELYNEWHRWHAVRSSNTILEMINR